MRIHFGSLASNNGFQIKMRLYKIHAYWVEHIESGVGCRDGGGLVMAVEKCRMCRWGGCWLWPWRGVRCVDEGGGWPCRSCRTCRWGWSCLWPWRGIGRGDVCFWFFVLRLKARPRKLLLRQIANAIYDEPIRNWVRRVPRHSKQIVSSKPTAFAAATDTKRLCRHESARKGLEGLHANILSFKIFGFQIGCLL